MEGNEIAEISSPQLIYHRGMREILFRRGYRTDSFLPRRGRGRDLQLRPFQGETDNVERQRRRYGDGRRRFLRCSVGDGIGRRSRPVVRRRGNAALLRRLVFRPRGDRKRRRGGERGSTCDNYIKTARDRLPGGFLRSCMFFCEGCGDNGFLQKENLSLSSPRLTVIGPCL